MRLWESRERATAQELIEWLLSTMTSSGGWPVEWANMVAIEELRASSSEHRLRSGFFMKTLSEMRSKGVKTVDDFETIFHAQSTANKAALAKQSGDTWQFFIPVNVTISEQVLRSQPKIRILGKSFSLISRRSLERRLPKNVKETLSHKGLLHLRTKTNIDKVPPIFLSVSANGPDWDSAWKNIEPAFDALRGMIEMTFDFFGFRLISDGQGARHNVSHPLWMIAYKKGQVSPEWIHFIADEDPEAKPFELTKQRLRGLQNNASVLARRPTERSTISLIANCLRLYSQAMDARFPHLSFLGFWQLAEAVTNAETFGGKTEKVVARLAWHGPQLGFKGSGYESVLKRLSTKRNSIVHRGIHDIENDDINVIKIACEAAVNWLFQIHKSLPTVQHVEQYYRFRQSTRPEINSVYDSINYIRKRRGKRKKTK